MKVYTESDIDELSKPIKELGLSTRFYNALRRFGKRHVYQIAEEDEALVERIIGIGKKSKGLKEIKTALAVRGLSFGMEFTEYDKRRILDRIKDSE